ncbi:hypothetical protein SPRG_03051 [Saprolegnia parasitica CBS 223.65]|uniref:Dolichol kinase n=1 Tax=Saprolegnia parasitica (strain CBS 223.65) TaxID=695850 RepID=A0A067D0L1_SAPPC|nr:hypothetical protein SPRG_03051 [Saprolegnia parasitica CBS 223.65]KDO32577.1 hypothetical protein SPRG_03051 [Saprolegnia parasitica CBS 223.65]|eukprot:XP_012197022.1 hypothetical protein SPRG_03051 [Saprolegnia parasitica CBS 223.65]
MTQEGWPHAVTAAQAAGLLTPPVAALALLLVLLRVVYKPHDASFHLDKHANYGSLSDFSETESDADDIIYAGEVAGDYSAPWTATFDLAFVAGMAVGAVALSITTSIVQPRLFTDSGFWLSQLVKILCMLVVSTLGGLVCRFFCIVDDHGYVMTTRNSVFKVNYTRKLQHFAAYLIPLLRPIVRATAAPTLEMAWAYYCTLACFLLLIKPLRERSRLCMLQFNALDRPEDRPHTLKWLIAGNLVPGFGLVTLFSAVFENVSFLLLIVLIVCIGDGLAEPVGIAFGRHKYLTSSCLSQRRYTRSFEGSAVVFLSTLTLPAVMYASFASPTQVFATMALLPPVVTYAEAKSPHTVDTPILMLPLARSCT